MKVIRRQFLKISSGAIGTVAAAEAMSRGADTSSVKEQAFKVPIKTGKQVPSICPYCAVGCGQIVMVSDAGKIIDIQGNPDSPINQGTLCPKGAATYQLVNNDLRWTTVKYRAPGSDHWEDKPLDWAMGRIAELTKKTRDAHFNDYQDIPYVNLQSPLSVGSWALMVFGAFSLLSFLDNLVAEGRLKSAPFAKFYNHLPRKVYAVIGSAAGFFVAGYTGVLLNITARPLWAATEPLLGSLFIASGASTGAATIALVMARQKQASGDAIERLQSFDRLAMIIELALIVLMIIIAGRYAAPLLFTWYGLLFWVGTVLLGILAPLWLHKKGGLPGIVEKNPVMLAAVLVLFGGAILRIALVQAGQM